MLVLILLFSYIEILSKKKLLGSANCKHEVLAEVDLLLVLLLTAIHYDPQKASAGSWGRLLNKERGRVANSRVGKSPKDLG